MTLAERHEALAAELVKMQREWRQQEARRRIKVLLDEQEKNLPANVPLHKRGFGVMDESA